jgi:malate dehydrogenase (oxaloacetate-decarboxylating)
VLASFNDDIQGTAAVAVAGIMAGGRITGTPLGQQRIVILGAGAAGIGIARLLRRALRDEGLTGEALTAAIACVDSRGLLVDDQQIGDLHKREFAWPAALAAARGLSPGQPRDLAAVVRAARPTVLVGTSGEPGTFTEPVIRSMAPAVARPLVLPMAHPTSLSVAVPEDVIRWTDGQALVATGSPFAPVIHGGRTHHIGQGNNAFVFPGVGLGALVAEAREITDGVFAAAARQLASEIHQQDLEAGSLFPPIADIRRVTAGIAAAVVRQARDEGVGRPLPDDQIPAAVAAAMWYPDYPSYTPG